MSALPPAAATAGVVAAGWGKFSMGYSRSLWLFDAGFRFERMNAGYEFANVQQEQYRADLQMMTELTFRKMAIYTVIGTMGMAIFIAIFCAGRLGLHGPSPPVWIMGLFLTNIAMAFAFASMGIWLAFHAMWRAKAACVHLNTRKVRLLIPTRKRLDQARKYGSQWEHQKFRDLLKVPYISDFLNWKWSGEVPDVSDEEENAEFSDGSGSDRGSGRARSAPPLGRRGREKRDKRMKRVPGWIQEEWEQERVGIAGGSGNTGQPSDAPPEHFQLYAKAQKEWFTHDCYSRVCMFYSFLSFFQGAAFYGLGQINIELRAWWPAFGNNFLFAVLHFLMLRFDIIESANANEFQKLRYCQYAGTATIPIAAIGMALDFRVEYSEPAIHMTWVCIFVCYLLQILYAARLLELLMPSEIRRDERTGNMWWPVGWKVPASFQHVFYFVAPPPRIAPERGQCDVVRELKEGYYSKSGEGGKKDQEMVFTPPVTALEDYFQFMFNVAWGQLSPASQERVRTLYRKFENIRNRGGGMSTPVANELGHIEAELRGIEKEECPDSSQKSDGYGSGSDSGSGSDHSGAYSSSGKSDYSKEYSKDTPRKHPDSPDFTRVSYAEPWRLAAIVTGTFLFSWCFLTVAMVIDRALGVQALVTAPHWAKPPMSRSSCYPWEYGTPIGLQRHYAGQTPWTPEELYWHENHKPRPQGWLPHWMDYGHEGRRLHGDPVGHTLGHGKGGHGDPGHHGGECAMKTLDEGKKRRLLETGMKQAFNNLISVLPTSETVAELLQRVPTKDESTALTNLESRFRHTSLGWNPKAFTWPGFFEPKMLACAPAQDGGHNALAVTSRGVAAVAQLGGNGEAERVILTGLSSYPPLLAASWGAGSKEGLMLVTKMGDLLRCPGARTGKLWACSPLADAPARLPIADGVRLAAATSAWLGGDSSPRLHVATIFENSPDTVALWVLEGNTEAASWMPAGELPVPPKIAGGASLHFVNDGDILLATPDGATIQRRISDGGIVSSTMPLSLDAEKHAPVHWQAACGLHGPNGGVAHLAMRHHGNSRRPEVMVMRMTPVGA